jgi:hypothetical protein
MGKKCCSKTKIAEGYTLYYFYMPALKYIKQKYAFKRETVQQSITNNFFLLKK